jgi:hypothetical protein
LLSARTSAQVIVIEFVTTTAGDLEFVGHHGDRQLRGTQLGQQVADEGSAVSMDQLPKSFRIAPAWGLCPQTPKVFRFRTGLMSRPSHTTKAP